MPINKTPEELAEIEALGNEAKRVLAPNSVFNRILTLLTKEYVAELMGCPVYDLTAQAAHAKLVALEAIKQRFVTLETNMKVHNERRT